MSNWKNRQTPTLDHLMSLFDDGTTSAFITGHLILEAILVQFVDIKLKDAQAFDAFSLNFPQKTDLCVALGVFDASMANYLKKINTTRNRIAHRLGYALTFDELFELAREAALVGIEFSDGTIHQDRAASAAHYGEQGVIQEIFQNTAQWMDFVMEELGGELQFC